jgi:hypothetical protein
LTQSLIAELFGVGRSTITEHINNILKDGELLENNTVGKNDVDNSKKPVKIYNLDMIIAGGYRVNSKKATQFRIWATKVLKEYLITGVVMDDERLKNPNYIFGEDYSVTGNTAAEIIYNRVDANKDNMGLTNWTSSPDGPIYKYDVDIAKNYLTEKELKNLNRIVTMYLDYAELQAENHNAMTMKDWIEKLDAFLQFNGQEILHNAGSISHKVAQELAYKEYDKFKKKQDELFISDFDKDDVKLEDVDEITSIKIDRRKPKEERILDFLTKVKNPYIFKVNGKLIRIRFSENTDLTADDCLTNVLKNLYK